MEDGEGSGGPAAEFAAFYAVSAPRVMRQLMLLTGDVFEAEDVVQEAFERAWLRWSTVRDMESPEAWVAHGRPASCGEPVAASPQRIPGVAPANGWADRPQNTIGQLMSRAVEAAEPRRLSAFEPTDDAYVAVIQKLDQKPGNASWRASVLDRGWGVCKVLAMGEPAAVAGHLAHWNPARAATILHAARAHLCPR